MWNAAIFPYCGCMKLQAHFRSCNITFCFLLVLVYGGCVVLFVIWRKLKVGPVISVHFCNSKQNARLQSVIFATRHWSLIWRRATVKISTISWYAKKYDQTLGLNARISIYRKFVSMKFVRGWICRKNAMKWSKQVWSLWMVNMFVASESFWHNKWIRKPWFHIGIKMQQ